MMEAAVDFFRQGGYAFFVWGAFGVTFLLMLAEVARLRQNRRPIVSRVGRFAATAQSRRHISGGGKS